MKRIIILKVGTARFRWENHWINRSCLDFQTVESVGSFLTTSSQVHLDGTSVIVGYPHRIDICNFQGTVKNSIKIEESEGELLQLDECNKCIVLVRRMYFFG